MSRVSSMTGDLRGHAVLLYHARSTRGWPRARPLPARGLARRARSPPPRAPRARPATASPPACRCGSSRMAQGGHIDHVQVYTVARAPSDPRCGPLDPKHLEAIAAAARDAGLTAAVYA